jgi:hypothetical protein
MIHVTACIVPRHGMPRLAFVCRAARSTVHRCGIDWVERNHAGHAIDPIDLGLTPW